MSCALGVVLGSLDVVCAGLEGGEVPAPDEQAASATSIVDASSDL